MKRKFLIVLLALTLAIVSAFALTACGETEKPDDGNGDNGNSTVVTPGGDTDNDDADNNDTDNNGGGNTDDGGNMMEPDTPTTEGLKFTLLDDDTYEVIGCEGNPTTIEIPSEYNGKKVTSIGDQAFFYCNSLTSIAISYNVTRIGSGAFEWCGSLESATIPNSVIGIKNSAFSGCYHLVEVYNLSSLNITEEWRENGGLGYYALDIYYDKNTSSKLTKESDFVIHTDGDVKTCIGYFGDRTVITIPKGTTRIMNMAFVDCNSVTSITIPDSVTSIGSSAFV